MSALRIEIYQQHSIAPDDSRLALFCRRLAPGTLVVLPEYTLSAFFTDLRGLSSKQILLDQSRQLESLESLSQRYALHFIAPIITAGKKRLYKQIAHITPESSFYYMQQRLISYEHWNEVEYFANPQPKRLSTPAIFRLGGCKIAMMFGFEIHFDELWCKLRAQGVDIVIMPCANTFDSAARWRELCKMRAFLNGCAIVRANRVGEAQVDGHTWRFYGDSLIAMPNGEILDHLGDTQERLSITLHREQITQMAREWGFREVFDI